MIRTRNFILRTCILEHWNNDTEYQLLNSLVGGQLDSQTKSSRGII